MFFETEKFKVELAHVEDAYEIAEVYNSNKKFLINHIGKDKIDGNWVIEELEDMRKIDFNSCKIIEKESNEVAGVLDFKIEKETYLSILILKSDYKNKGIGKLLYGACEKYAKFLGSEIVRIDVVTNYDANVFKFWSSNGFIKFKDVRLSWGGKELPAVIMKKEI